MVNAVLFMSAVLCSAIHAVGIGVTAPHPAYALFLAAACATSLWNHRTTSMAARITDRTVMAIGIPVTAVYHPHPVTWATLAALSLSYAAAKATNRNAPHIIAHVLITALNLRILGLY